nr:unnamed protein product [Digitaria exilis]
MSMFQKKCMSEMTASGESFLMRHSWLGLITASSTAAAAIRHASAGLTTVRFSTPAGRPSTTGNGYVATSTLTWLGLCRAMIERTNGAFAVVTATVASTTSGRAAARWTAKLVKGPMWLLAKKGMRRMRSFLLWTEEAIARMQWFLGLSC